MKRELVGRIWYAKYASYKERYFDAALEWQHEFMRVNVRRALVLV